MRSIAPALEQRIEKSRHRFESKEKAAIADMLKSYGIPFFYKQPMLVNESGQKTIEYADYLRKEQIYTQNPLQAVLVTRRDFNDKSWQSTLYKKLERLYHRRPVYRSSGSYR